MGCTLLLSATFVIAPHYGTRMMNLPYHDFVDCAEYTHSSNASFAAVDDQTHDCVHTDISVVNSSYDLVGLEHVTFDERVLKSDQRKRKKNKKSNLEVRHQVLRVYHIRK